MSNLRDLRGSETSLSECELLCIDIETYDPLIKDLGFSYHWNQGHILGVAIGGVKRVGNTIDVDSFYLDLSKEESRQIGSRELSILRHICNLPMPKLGHNLLYDYSWLYSIGCPLNGELRDTSIAEALLNEWRSTYSLESIANDRLQTGKEVNQIEEYLRSKGIAFKDHRAELLKVPSDLIQKYAVEDVNITIQIYLQQLPELEQQGLRPVFDLECSLLRPLHLMNLNGVRIDLERKKVYRELLIEHLEQCKDNLYRKGVKNLNSSQQLSAVLEEYEDIICNKTPTGQPSVTNKWLNSISKESEIAKDILMYKSVDKIYGTFIEGAFKKFLAGDKIHCMLHGTRDTFNGTKTGRFSCSKPNMQQIPSEDLNTFEDTVEGSYAEFCRRICIPEDDSHLWLKLDYSQIEYRVLAHYAIGDGAAELRSAYQYNPDTDYHGYIQDLTGLSRKLAKNLNFGIMYGMGINSMAEFFGWEKPYCQDLRNIYKQKAPYVEATSKKIKHGIDRMISAFGEGYIETVLGRRARLNHKNKSYIMINRLIQGSAADILKKAINDIYTEGLFDVALPHLTVHDELDLSIPKSKEGREATKAIKNTMETAVKLNVPIIVDAAIGNNWQDVTKANYTMYLKGKNKFHSKSVSQNKS